MSDLKQRIDEDVKSAMRARDRERLGVLRQITAAIKQREVDERIQREADEPIQLDDAGVVAVLDKMVKMRRDAHEQFEKAGRADLAAQEAFEIEVVQAYMPAPLAEAEIAELIDLAIAETGASGLRDMGKVMGALKGRVQGRADLGAVSAAVKSRLAGG